MLSVYKMEDPLFSIAAVSEHPVSTVLVFSQYAYTTGTECMNPLSADLWPAAETDSVFIYLLLLLHIKM